MAINGDGISVFYAFSKMGDPRRNPGKKAKCAIYMHPAIMLSRQFDHVLYRIKLSTVNLTGVYNDNCWLAIQFFKGLLHGFDIQPAKIIADAFE